MTDVVAREGPLAAELAALRHRRCATVMTVEYDREDTGDAGGRSTETTDVAGPRDR